MSTSNQSQQVDELINPPDVPEPRSEGGNDLLNRITNLFGDDIGEDELPLPDNQLIDENERTEGA